MTHSFPKKVEFLRETLRKLFHGRYAVTPTHISTYFWTISQNL